MMKYQLSRADHHSAPASYVTEDRYLGYRETDRAQSYAKYFRDTVDPVQTHVHEAIAAGRQPSEFSYTIDEAARRMSRPGYENMETGYARRADGGIQISVLTKMPGATAEMWDWWFGWHSSETARYKLWHPEAHYYTGVGEDRSADRTLSDKQRYIGNVSYVDEYVGPDASPLTVRFLNPTLLGFEEPKPGNTIIAARGGLSTMPIGFAWLVHQVRETTDGCEMRSRFFVNDFQMLPVPAAAVTSKPGKLLTGRAGPLARPLLRKVAERNPDTFGPAMLMHCAQEMNHLSRFLPQLHEEFSGTP